MKLSDITLDTALQPRVKINQEVVNEYAERMEEGAVFPALLVYDDGEKKYLVDGWHRYFAYKKIGKTDIEVIVRKGTHRDAKLCSFGVNGLNGQGASKEDKHKAVVEMLNDVEWEEWSDREIAKRCYVSHTFVSKIRSEMGKSRDKIKFERDGKEYTINKKVEKQNDIETPDINPEENQIVELATEISSLNEELEATQRRLAIAAVEATPEEKSLYSKTLEEMASRIKTLESDIRVITASRDTFQREAAELKKQCFYWEKRAKKAEHALEMKMAAK